MFFFIKFLLWADNINTRLINKMLILKHGYHPKHDVIKYPEWFASKIPANSVILDIGYGDGAIIKKIQHQAKKVIGIDLKTTDGATWKLHNVELIQQDALKLRPETLTDVQYVVVSNILEHLEKRDVLLARLRRASQLKQILVRVPDLERHWIVEIKRKYGVEWRSDPTHVIEHSEGEIKDEVLKAGFKIVEYEKRFGEHYLIVEPADI